MRNRYKRSSKRKAPFYTQVSMHTIMIFNNNHILKVSDETLKLTRTCPKSKTYFCKYSPGFLNIN